MAGQGFGSDGMKSMKANAQLRGKRKSFKDISNIHKSNEIRNYPVFDKESQKEFAKKDAIAFYVVAFVVFSLSLVAMMYIL